MKIEQKYSEYTKSDENDVEWLRWNFKKFWLFLFERKHFDVIVDVYFEQCVFHIELIV